MITANDMGQQTGLYSRIANPRTALTTAELDRRIHDATNPRSPKRNPLSMFGEAPSGGILSRIAAWLRGE